jgi:hypothetical protein
MLLKMTKFAVTGILKVGSLRTGSLTALGTATGMKVAMRAGFWLCGPSSPFTRMPERMDERAPRFQNPQLTQE